ncbi:unnamed protein product [Medioppia subpectinata]|uniref:Uncharacterized protein n=1 Tax=Medioppia subpectinata TaxID=1979941 RepID=A0A7R9KXI4_9ACAR|nr:unnamed protein product [Medioppia subpectinata]CAG2111687.1 unnamed protein product [Medioppia subpectinata]
MMLEQLLVRISIECSFTIILVPQSKRKSTMNKLLLNILTNCVLFALISCMNCAFTSTGLDTPLGTNSTSSNTTNSQNITLVPSATTGTGMNGTGTTAPGMPGQGMPGTVMPGQGMPGQGMPGQGIPGTGMPATPAMGMNGTAGSPTPNPRNNSMADNPRANNSTGMNSTANKDGTNGQQTTGQQTNGQQTDGQKTNGTQTNGQQTINGTSTNQGASSDRSMTGNSTSTTSPNTGSSTVAALASMTSIVVSVLGAGVTVTVAARDARTTVAHIDSTGSGLLSPLIVGRDSGQIGAYITAVFKPQAIAGCGRHPIAGHHTLQHKGLALAYGQTLGLSRESATSLCRGFSYGSNCRHIAGQSLRGRNLSGDHFLKPLAHNVECRRVQPDSLSRSRVYGTDIYVKSLRASSRDLIQPYAD